ncbi:initiator tRNA phosphoribosyl transferase-domain-containing protein [Suillus ampliporus]|nr:initiator tRNA phosphoribosyl transferase-domain-containing protein [Suillus ampliporus]
MGNKDGAVLAFNECHERFAFRSRDSLCTHACLLHIGRCCLCLSRASILRRLTTNYVKNRKIYRTVFVNQVPWYTNPNTASDERAYFKSTYRHTGNWSFNLRRPNLHVVPLICYSWLDSTRAGKRMPDTPPKSFISGAQ